MTKRFWQFWKKDDKKVQPKMSQLQTVMVHLRKNGSITSWEAITSYNITRLSAVIFRLKNEVGLKIDATLINTTTRSGEPVRYTIYTLDR
jgi:hypothetical protein